MFKTLSYKTKQYVLFLHRVQKGTVLWPTVILKHFPREGGEEAQFCKIKAFSGKFHIVKFTSQCNKSTFSSLQNALDLTNVYWTQVYMQPIQVVVVLGVWWGYVLLPTPSDSLPMFGLLRIC